VGWQRLDAALQAQGWKALDAKTRAQHLHRSPTASRRPICTAAPILMSREMGKPYPEAIGEVGQLRRRLPLFRRNGARRGGQGRRQHAGRLLPVCPLRTAGRLRVHIMPFNFPILLMCWTVAASLAAGNGCIIKPAEATTLSTLDSCRVLPGRCRMGWSPACRAGCRSCLRH
jgi:acyl-CoA reductase-like NAD-dependent aldehyde dehydrogenase